MLKKAKENNVEVLQKNKFMPLWYKLKVNSKNQSSISLSNVFYETGSFSNVDPGFLFNFKENCTNDDDFNQLWGLNNSQNPNIDINACEAWNITEGNGVNVAVLDQGVFTAHNDLSTNISNLSYDTQNGTSPSVFTNDRNHGTHVAGTIAAIKDNDLQIVGVAPQSEIMSVSHILDITPNISEELADGINWAWQNGAHVINNSWGDQGGQFFNQLHSALLENAINNALTNGRNGLGTIMVFAAGNHSPAIDYPANSNPNIITVGAITSIGNRSNFSGFGNELDVVAPGSNIISTIPNQATASWDGTSMAAPHVSGIVALILSVNPNLTFQQVNDIIENTAQKIGNYNYGNAANRPNGTWNNEMGYGLVDAYASVQQAQQSLVSITGPDIVCSSNTKFYLQGGNNPTWSTSNNLSIVSSNNNNITVKALNPNTSGQGFVRTIFTNGTSVQKDVWVGTRKPIGFVNIIVDPWLGRIKARVEPVQGSEGYIWYLNGVQYTGPGMNSDYVTMPIPRNNCTIPDYIIGVKAINLCGMSAGYFELHENPCYEGEYYYSYAPNPISETLTVERVSPINPMSDNNAIDTAHQYTLHDFNGILIQEGNLSVRTEIDVSKLPDGRYILIIQIDKNDRETHHIIKK